MPKSTFLQEATARGFIHQCTDVEALDAAFQRSVVPAYIGFDCTADSLHVGSLLQIMILRLLQRHGHKPVVLMGGGTTRIGDPSGKDESRQMLTDEQITANMAGIRRCFGPYLNFGDGPTDAVMVDNDEWLSKLGYVELLRARETTGGEVNTNLAVSANQQWIRRRLDSSLLPTDGYQALALVGLGYAHGSGSDDSGPFGRMQLKLGVYKPLGGWYASARAEVAQVVAHERVGVPEKLLFLAGGDDSVRGYTYRSLGVERNGLTVGGRVLATGSLEIAHPFTMRMPSLWGALFVDAGNASSRWADYRPVVGYGAGLRWRSPVGPLRVDAARAQETGKWRLHFSVGITL